MNGWRGIVRDALLYLAFCLIVSAAVFALVTAITGGPLP